MNGETKGSLELQSAALITSQVGCGYAARPPYVHVKADKLSVQQLRKVPITAPSLH